jgi:AAA domain/Bifunctional DNA primase/polymerase, N-terminal/Primase C terminal 2 (PriCT-2)
MTDSYMARLGARLVDNGYPVLPIMPGTKKPGQFKGGAWRDYRGWTKHGTRPTSEHELIVWSGWPDAGIGIPTGTMIGVDIDIRDPELASRLEQLARETLGDTPAVRFGMQPKRLLVYRAAEPLSGMKAHPIEVLGLGQQFVAFADHPETRRPYEWPQESPADLPAESLPPVDETMIHAFLDRALELVPPELRPGRLPGELGARTVAEGAGDLRGTPDAIADALRFIPNADVDYDSWVRIGLALKGALGDDGWSLFAAWSATSSKDVPEFTTKTWADLRPERIGAGTIYHHARAAGWAPSPELVLNGALALDARHPAAPLLERARAGQHPASPGGAAFRSSLESFTLGHLLSDRSPMPDDLISPRLLTPGGLLVIGGAPKVGKSDFIIHLLAHLAGGHRFLAFAPPRPLRIFYLQAEIQYDYLRERLQQLALPPDVVELACERLVATPKQQILLSEAGVASTVAAVRDRFPDSPPDIICIDPIRNVFDGGPDGKGENDNSAMLFFLQKRVELLRDRVNPEAGVILCHHTKKIPKQTVADDPFQALSGAGSLRSFYTSGMIMHRPDEARPERQLFFELRNGPALEPMMVDKIAGRWVALDPKGERLVRQNIGRKLDAERRRKRDVILQLLFDEAAAGRMYTSMQFAERFENKAGLGADRTIRDRISVLATKGWIKFVRNYKDYGLPPAGPSKLGYLCVEDMVLGPIKEVVDGSTGEVTELGKPVRPSDFKCPQTGALLPVENPEDWVYQEDDPA